MPTLQYSLANVGMHVGPIISSRNAPICLVKSNVPSQRSSMISGVNELPQSDGYYFSAKLSDFGMARRVSGETENSIGGTPNYIAPELLRGEKIR